MMKITYINEMTGETVVEWMKVEECEPQDRVSYVVRGYSANGRVVASLVTKNYTRGLMKMLSKIDDPENWGSYSNIVKIVCERSEIKKGGLMFKYDMEFTIWEREAPAPSEDPEINLDELEVYQDLLDVYKKMGSEYQFRHKKAGWIIRRFAVAYNYASEAYLKKVVSYNSGSRRYELQLKNLHKHFEIVRR
jgi:hypothetical protein